MGGGSSWLRSKKRGLWRNILYVLNHYSIPFKAGTPCSNNIAHSWYSLELLQDGWKKHFRWLQDLMKLTETMARMCIDIIKGKGAHFEQPKIQNKFWFVQHMHILMDPYLFLSVFTHNVRKTLKQWMRKCVQTFNCKYVCVKASVNIYLMKHLKKPYLSVISIVCKIYSSPS